MNHVNRSFLQLFADGGEGAASSSAPGVQADPGQPRQQEAGASAKPSTNRAKGIIPVAQVAAAQPTEGSARPTWEQLMADPEYNSRMQQLVSARLKEAKQAQSAMLTLSPALDTLAKQYGVDPKDHDALAQAILGASKEDPAAASLEQERDNALQLARRQQARDLIRAHRENLQQQAERLRQVFPGFDLDKELQNPAFARMVGPGIGISVADAYHALHRREMEAITARAVAKNVAQRVAGSISSGTRRIAEHGANGTAPSVTTFDYRNATAAQQEALKQQIRAAAARGEKIYPR